MNSLLRAEAVAKVLDTSRQNVYNLAKAGTLRAVVFKAKSGKGPRRDRSTYRFREEDVAAFIEGHLCEGEAVR